MRMFSAEKKLLECILGHRRGILMTSESIVRKKGVEEGRRGVFRALGTS